MQQQTPGTGTKLKRSAQIASILTKHGFDILSESHSSWRFLAAPKKWFKREEDRKTQPAEVRAALEELGATFVKLGQAVSTRPDIVPPEYAVELAKLQDQAPVVPYPEIVQVFEEEFGHSPETVFAFFKPEPLAAASIGQVHSAILPDGSQIVVKVKRPDVDDRVEEDLAVMKDLTHFLSTRTEVGKQQDLDAWFDEFQFTLRNELVYTREGRNADRFRRNFQDDPALYIPKVYWEYTTDRVLTMERLSGIKIDDRRSLEEAGIDCHQLARTSALIVLKMIYDHGFFHADPHPGNFFVQPDGRIALMDFGMVGRLDEETKDSLMRITIGIAQRDSEALADETLAFAQARRPVQRWKLKRDIERLIETHLEVDPSRVSMAAMLQDILAAAGRHGLTLPSAIATLSRCLAMNEGMGKQLDPGFNLTAFAEPYLQELIKKRYSPEALVERARSEGLDMAGLTLDLPKKGRRLLSQLERGDLRITASLDDSEKLFQQMQVASNRLSMSMLVAGMIAGLCVLVAAFKPADMNSFAGAIIIAMLVVIIGAGFTLFLSIWRTGK